MEINRNQYFLAGLVILFLGIQFRMVDTFVLNEKATEVLAKQMNRLPTKPSSGPVLISVPSATRTGPAERKTFKPPSWLGWALMSVGGVLILHSLAMPRPD